jgi:hypothetical protein
VLYAGPWLGPRAKDPAWPYLVYVEMDEVLVFCTESLEHPWWDREKSITVETVQVAGLRCSQ